MFLGVGLAGFIVLATPIAIWVRHFTRKAFQPDPRPDDIAGSLKHEASTAGI